MRKGAGAARGRPADDTDLGLGGDRTDSQTTIRLLERPPTPLVLATRFPPAGTFAPLRAPRRALLKSPILVASLLSGQQEAIKSNPVFQTPRQA